MYRKGIPEVLRQKILKDTLWRLKLSAQLLLNDSLDGQWNATYGDSAGAELCSPETLLRLPHRVSGCLTLGGWARPQSEPQPGAPHWPPGTAWPSLERSEPLSPMQETTWKCSWRKCIFLGAHFFLCLSIFCVYLLTKLIVKLQKRMKPPEFWLDLGGGKGE